MKVIQMLVDNEYFIFKKLLWDTENLNLDTYELVFKKGLIDNAIQEIKFLHNIKGLIYIKNPTNYRENSKYIGINTKSVLYDTNITLKCNIKKEENIELIDYNYKILSHLHSSIDDLINYAHSRFFKDLEFSNKSRTNIYLEWIRNAQKSDDKMFITLEYQSEVLGFLLYSEHNFVFTIELISIKKIYQNMQLGSKLIKILKNEALKKNINEIFVGTQISNIQAINFYIKNGFLVVNTTDIYHWWKV
jgi:ribosomal protein S18 acetylase RimI-like enzyme